jgi:hypothetical protein
MKGTRKDAQKAGEISQALTADLDRSTVDPAGRLPFVAVPLARFVLMSLLTFSLYEIWWFYANWKRVQQRTGQNMYPFWRAIFAPIFCYFFVETVRQTSEKASVPVPLSAGVVAVSYLALIMTQELPDPWWWLCGFSFLPLIPVVQHVERLHHSLYPGLESYAPFGKGHVLSALIGVPMVGLAVAGTMMLPTRALTGAELPDAYREKLVELGHLEPDEQVLFFYSAALFSIEDEGNLLTDRRVVSYQMQEGGPWRASAPLETVAHVEVSWSQSDFEDTVITVHTSDDRSFRLIVSGEEERDRAFVEKLESLRQVQAALD